MHEDLYLLGERIAETAAHLDAATHRLLTDLREFEVKGGYYRAGAKSCAHWMSWRLGWELGTAREHVRVAKALGALPLIDDALRLGMCSYSKVRAMTRVATPKNERLLLADALLMTGSQLEKVCQKYRMVQRHDEPQRPEDDVFRRYVRRRTQDDGMVRIEAVLHADEAALVWAVLERAAKDMAAGIDPEDARSEESLQDEAKDVPAGTSAPLLLATQSAAPEQDEDLATDDEDPFPCDADGFRYTDISKEVPEEDFEASSEPRETVPVPVMRPNVPAGTPKPKFDRADALMCIMQRLASGTRQDCHPIEVVVTIPAAALRKGVAPSLENIGCLPDGDCIHGETGRRLSCDAGIVWMIEDEVGQPTSIGRRSRAIPAAVKRALIKRDGACRFPGCDNRIYVEGHHVEHWADGGETSLRNLVLVCSLHHRFVHEYNYRIEFDLQNGEPRFFDQKGRRVADVPPPIPTAHLGWSTIVAANQELAITPKTNAPRWDGQNIPYRDVVGYLSDVDRNPVPLDRYSESSLVVLGPIGRGTS